MFDLFEIVGNKEIVKLIFEASSQEPELRIVKGELMGCVHEGMLKNLGFLNSHKMKTTKIRYVPRSLVSIMCTLNMFPLNSLPGHEVPHSKLL